MPTTESDTIKSVEDLVARVYVMREAILASGDSDHNAMTTFQAFVDEKVEQIADAVRSMEDARRQSWQSKLAELVQKSRAEKEALQEEIKKERRRVKLELWKERRSVKASQRQLKEDQWALESDRRELERKVAEFEDRLAKVHEVAQVLDASHDFHGLLAEAVRKIGSRSAKERLSEGSPPLGLLGESQAVEDLLNKLLPARDKAALRPFLGCAECVDENRVTLEPVESVTDAEWRRVKKTRAALARLGATRTQLVQCRWLCHHRGGQHGVGSSQLALRAEVERHGLVLSRLYEIGRPV